MKIAVVYNGYRHKKKKRIPMVHCCRTSYTDAHDIAEKLTAQGFKNVWIEVVDDIFPRKNMKEKEHEPEKNHRDPRRAVALRLH